MVAFVDLPMDIHFAILDHLDDRSLSELAFVSRPLNRIALTTLLTRLSKRMYDPPNLEDWWDPEKPLTIGSNFSSRVLNALRRALFIRRKTEIVYESDWVRPRSYLASGIARFIENLAVVEELTILNVGRDRCVKLLSSMGTMLDGLTSSNIRSLRFIDPNVKPCCTRAKHPSPFRKLFACNIFPHCRFREKPQLYIQPSDDISIYNPMSSLQELHLQTNLVRDPSFLVWTLRTLSNSSSTLTKLVIWHVGLKPEEFGMLLPHINLPVLSTLKIATFDLRYADLAWFLHRHQKTIVHLDISEGALTFDIGKEDKLPSFTLPALTHLRISADHTVISGLYSASSAEYPALETIVITPAGPVYSDAFKPSFYMHALAAISALFGRAALQATVQVIFSPSAFPARPRFPQTFKYAHIRKLSLATDGSAPLSSDPNFLPSWLASFPVLQEIEVSYDCLAKGEASVVDFVTKISTVCPLLEVVVVGDTRRNIKDWLSSNA